MQLSETPKAFCQFFIVFLESTLNFGHFGKKCMKALASENPFGSEHVKSV